MNEDYRFPDDGSSLNLHYFDESSSVLYINAQQKKKEGKDKKSKDYKELNLPCKICLEIDNPGQGKLIKPCRCSGSVGLIHEECLRTWLISKSVDLEDSACELCGYKYRMIMRFKNKFYPKSVCDNGILSICSIACIGTMLTVLLSVLVLIATNWDDQTIASSLAGSKYDPKKETDTNKTVFKIVILIIIVTLLALLLTLAAYLTKKFCFIKELKKWEILDSDDIERQRTVTNNGQANGNNDLRIVPNQNAISKSHIEQDITRVFSQKNLLLPANLNNEEEKELRKVKSENSKEFTKFMLTGKFSQKKVSNNKIAPYKSQDSSAKIPKQENAYFQRSPSMREILFANENFINMNSEEEKFIEVKIKINKIETNSQQN